MIPMANFGCCYESLLSQVGARTHSAESERSLLQQRPLTELKDLVEPITHRTETLNDNASVDCTGAVVAVIGCSLTQGPRGEQCIISKWSFRYDDYQSHRERLCNWL